MRVWLVVADQSEARFYELRSHDVELGRLADPLARLHDQDLVSDRPGRKFDRAPLIAGRRGAIAHHATGRPEAAAPLAALLRSQRPFDHAFVVDRARNVLQLASQDLEHVIQ